MINEELFALLKEGSCSKILSNEQIAEVANLKSQEPAIRGWWVITGGIIVLLIVIAFFIRRRRK